MRIALISEHASPLADIGSVDAGGQNVYVREVGLHLAAGGHSVVVYTRRDSPDVEDSVEMAPGLQVVHVPAGPTAAIAKEELLQYMPEFAEWVIADVTGRAIDLVHANFFMSGLVARDVRRELGVPYVVTFHALGAVRRIHQGKNDRFPTDRTELEQQVIDDATAVIAECPQDEADLLRFYEVSRNKIVTIPCGVDTDTFRPVGRSLARARRGWQDDEWIVLHVGRMVPRKGVETLIEAMAVIRERAGDNTRLVVVGGSTPDPGEDDEIRRLMARAAELGVEDRVSFEGRVDHHMLPQYYGAADVFATTPWYEPFGITPLEAMACGLPVVGSNVGGIKYTVRDGETGILVPPRQAEAVADALSELRDHPRIAAALSTNARRRARDLFTWKKVASSLGELYEEVLSGPLPSGEETQLPAYERARQELIELLERSRGLATEVTEAARVVSASLRRGGKVLVAGNGGSAAQAQHFAAELVGRFLIPERRALPVVSLTCDGAVLTAWSNDTGFADVFARQVEGLGRPGDILLGISTSGNSENLVQAFKAAREVGLTTVGLLGGDGGRMVEVSDVTVMVPSRNTQRIQEIHDLLVHVLSSQIEAAVASPDLSGAISSRRVERRIRTAGEVSL